MGGVVVGEPFAHHADDDLVGHQLAGIEKLAGLLAELGTGPGGSPEGVAGGDVRHDVVARQPHRLRPLPRPLLPEDDQSGAGVHLDSLRCRPVTT